MRTLTEGHTRMTHAQMASCLIPDFGFDDSPRLSKARRESLEWALHARKNQRARRLKMIVAKRLA